MGKKALLGMSVLLVVLGLLSQETAWAEDFAVISTADLKAKMDSGEKITLINPLSDIEFKDQAIPGSENMPIHVIETTDKLPDDKSALIVTYCLGPT